MKIKTLETVAEEAIREEKERIAVENIKRLKTQIHRHRNEMIRYEDELKKYLTKNIDDIPLMVGPQNTGQNYGSGMNQY